MDTPTHNYQLPTNAPFTVQAVCPAVISCLCPSSTIRGSYATLTQCQNVHYLVHSMEVLKGLKFPPLNSEPQACADEFLMMVTEDVFHVVHKVVTRPSFGIIWQGKVS